MRWPTLKGERLDATGRRDVRLQTYVLSEDKEGFPDLRQGVAEIVWSLWSRKGVVCEQTMVCWLLYAAESADSSMRLAAACTMGPIMTVYQ
jgi:hypothetical protein